MLFHGLPVLVSVGVPLGQQERAIRSVADHDSLVAGRWSLVAAVALWRCDWPWWWAV